MGFRPSLRSKPKRSLHSRVENDTDFEPPCNIGFTATNITATHISRIEEEFRDERCLTPLPPDDAIYVKTERVTTVELRPGWSREPETSLKRSDLETFREDDVILPEFLRGS